MEKPWVEKYRPKSLDEVIGQEEVVKVLKSYVQRGISSMPHLMFCGKQGTGKTATAYALANELGVDIVEFNASDERGIGFIRDTIMPILQTAGSRLVLLDEADHLTPDAQASLRRAMERALDMTENRMILTCNYPGKIIDPIKSRCATFKFKPLSEEDCARVLLTILKREGVLSQIASDKQQLKEVLIYLIRISGGDMRKAINALQNVVVAGLEVTKETIEKEFKEAKLEEEMIKHALDGNWEACLESLRTYLNMGTSNPRQLVHKLGKASEQIENLILRERFLRGLKFADIALADPNADPYIQIGHSLLQLYVYKHVLPKK